MFSKLFLGLTLLTQSALCEPCKVLLEESVRSVSECHGLKVVRLRGEPLHRARAMGELLRGPLSPQVVHYFSEKVPELLAHEAGILGGAFTLFFNQVVRLFHRATPPFLAEEVDAMAQGMGVDPIVLRRGLSLPDTAVLLQGLGSYPLLAFLPPVGCTSAAAPKANGGFVFGRNLDFAGVGTYDRLPMLLSIEPPEGSRELRHLVIGAHGLLFGGITGVNEAGIGFAVHQQFSRDAGVYGVPMILIGELILRGARSLDEAEAILKAHRPAGVWTFVVTDLKSGESMAVEASQKVFLSRRSNGKVFAQTNHSLHEQSRAWENADLGILFNSEFRMKQAHSMLEGNPAPDASLLARVLSYQHDPKGQLSAYRDVLKGETIQTAIFETEPGKPSMLYLSVDEAPSSAGKYAALRLEHFWDRNEKGALDVALVDLARTPPEKRVRQREIANAFHTYFDLRRPLEASAILHDHATLDGALFRALAQYQADHFQQALGIAEQALLDPRFVSEPAHIRQSVETVRLVSFLRLGRGMEARNLAQKLLDEGTAKNQLRRLCQHVLRNEMPPAWMLKPTFNFFSGDLGGRKD